MDTEAMFYVFGPLVAYAVGVGIAFFCYSVAEFSNESWKNGYERGRLEQCYDEAELKKD